MVKVEQSTECNKHRHVLQYDDVELRRTIVHHVATTNSAITHDQMIIALSHDNAVVKRTPRSEQGSVIIDLLQHKHQRREQRPQEDKLHSTHLALEQHVIRQTPPI